MSYTYPDANAVSLTWAGATGYTYPEYNAANLSFSPPGNFIAFTLDSVTGVIQVAQGYTQLTSLNTVLEDTSGSILVSQGYTQLTSVSYVLENVDIAIEATRSSIYAFNNELIHQGAYTPPLALDANFDFNPPPSNFYYPWWDFVLDDVEGVISIAYTMNVSVSVVLDDVTALISCIPDCYASIDMIVDDTDGINYALTAPPVLIECSLDDAVAEIESGWFSGVWRGVWASSSSRFTTRDAFRTREVSSRHQQALKPRPVFSKKWADTSKVSSVASSSWKASEYKKSHASLVWGTSAHVARVHSTKYASPDGYRKDVISIWGEANPHSIESLSKYNSPPPKRESYLSAFERAATSSLDYWLLYQKATQVFTGWTVYPWETANPHSWIWGGWPLPPPPPPPPPYTPSPNLEFYQTILDYVGGAILEHAAPCYAWPIEYSPPPNPEIQIPGVYIVLHTITVHRLPDMTEIPVLGVSLKFDKDSWAWGISLNLKSEEGMAMLEPSGSGEPRQVKVNLDGFIVTGLIEEWSKNEVFGSTTYTASGRSSLALLASPYSPIRSYTETQAKTASQLIDFELENTGWTAAYHSSLSQLFTTDWMIPGGVRSYQNQSRIEAILSVARAAGARAYADRVAQILKVVPEYPVSPWNWASATVDRTIPVALANSISTQLAPQPAYNQVYVSGANNGVLVNVTRQGSGGNTPAPMVVDPLITYMQAGQERGRNILSNTGRQAVVTLDLPMNEVTGMLEPGHLVEVQAPTYWRGLVVGTSISATLGKIRQQVAIQRHY